MAEQLEMNPGCCASTHDAWMAREIASQTLPPFRGSERAGTDGTAANLSSGDSGLQRVFPPGMEITHDLIEKTGMANDPAQLNLERNLIYRDMNPNAYFTTPGLNDKIDRLTGTRGDCCDPANLASNMELTGTALKVATVLRNHEAAAKIAQWRDNNPDKMVDQGFPPRLSPEQVVQETSPAKIQDAINAIYAEKGQPMLGAANIAKFAPLKAYKPEPTFDETKAFAADADKYYLLALVGKRKELLG